MTPKYSTNGRSVWFGTVRVVCDADTDAMARFIADALNEKGKRPPEPKK
jgi:hypothetical protein